jgi:O-antigen/teichoic acid export membrane protein
MLSSRPEPAQEPVGGRSSSGGQAFLLLLLSRVVSLLAGVAFVAVTARSFPASEIAFLAWVVILSSAAETVRGFGLTLVLTRRLPLCDHEPVEAARWVTTHFLYASLPLLLLPVIAAPFLPTLWTVAAAGAALQLVVNNHIYVFQAMGQFRTVTLGAMFSTFFQRLAPLAAAWHWEMGLEPFLLLQALLSLPVCLVLTYQLRAYLTSPTVVPWREFWPQARAFYASGFVRYGATQADQLMVALLFPPQTLAPYFLVRRLYSALVVVLSAGIDVLTPQLGRRALAGIDQVRLDQARILKKATALCALGGGLIAANAGAMVPLVIGGGYSAPRFVVPALLMAALGYGLFSFAVAGEVVAGPPKETFRITLIAAVVPLLVAPVLVPVAGVAALPLALAVGYLMAAWYVLRRQEQLRTSALPALAAMAVVGLLCALQEGIPAGPRVVMPSPVILNLAALGLAAVVSFRCRILSPLGVQTHE